MEQEENIKLSNKYIHTHTHHFTPTHVNTEGKKQDTKELKQCTWIDAYKIQKEVK